MDLIQFIDLIAALKIPDAAVTRRADDHVLDGLIRIARDIANQGRPRAESSTYISSDRRSAWTASQAQAFEDSLSRR